MKRPLPRAPKGSRRAELASRAFTLLELLTVIGIIGVLSSLLVPALGRAKTTAQRASCGGNLRQLTLAGQMYWDDNSGQAFRWRGAATNGGQIFWFGWLQNGAEGQRRFDATQGALYPYLGSRGVEVCPGFRLAGSGVKLKASGASYAYGYNLSLSAPASAPPVNLEKVRRPSELVFLADSAQVNTFQAPAAPDHPMLEEFYYLNTTEPTAHFRHQMKANAAFCDGHVGWEKPLPGSLDERLPNQRIGRFRPEILRIE